MAAEQQESADGESPAGDAAGAGGEPAAAAVTEGAASEASPSEGAPTDPPADDGGGGEDDASGDAGEATPEAAADGVEAGATPSGTPGEGTGPGTGKRKRRRRRKKHGDGPAPEHAAAQEQAPQRPRQRPQRPATDRAPFHVGEEVFGKVTAVLDAAIMVDLAGKALGIFDRSEMETDDLLPSPGDRIVARVHNDGARGGLVVLTRKPLREEESKPLVEAAHKEGKLIHGLVTGVVKGGVEVDIGGLRAFAPASGVDLHPQNANFHALLGTRLDFKVVSYDRAGRDVVVTRRPMLEAEAHERRKHALTLLEEGQVQRGIVRTVVEWGAFVAMPDAENLEGLVHVSEASHDPRTRLDELFQPGQALEVKIVKIDERGKIWLSRKALVPDPWAEAKQKYAPRSRHTGKVMRLQPFGAFIELEPGIDALLHVSDLSIKRIEHPKELLTVGQEIQVVVANFDPRTQRIAVHPAPKPEHENEQPQKIQRNAAVKAEVVKAEAAGVQVRLLGMTGRAAAAFIPAGQTGTTRGTDLRKHFKAGAIIDAKVIDIDPRRGEAKLSIKGLAEDEERKAHRDYRQALAREAKFGTLGDLFAAKLR